jgi:hypothetical protein
MKKRKTMSIEEASEWLAKTCPNIYKLCTEPEPIKWEGKMFLGPRTERVEKVVFSHIPDPSKFDGGGFMAFRKHRNSFEPLKTPHKRTHRKGSKIRSIATFRKWCMNGNPIYYNHKFMHYGFATSMPFRGVCDALSQGRIWKAVRI